MPQRLAKQVKALDDGEKMSTANLKIFLKLSSVKPVVSPMALSALIPTRQAFLKHAPTSKSLKRWQQHGSDVTSTFLLTSHRFVHSTLTHSTAQRHSIRACHYFSLLWFFNNNHCHRLAVQSIIALIPSWISFRIYLTAARSGTGTTRLTQPSCSSHAKNEVITTQTDLRAMRIPIHFRRILQRP